MKAELRTVGTDIHFEKIIKIGIHTTTPEEIKGAKVIWQSDSGLCLVECPAVAVRLDTSRFGDGFLDGIFRLDETDKWQDGIEITSFDGELIERINSLYMPDKFLPWDNGLRHHRKVIDEILQKTCRYSSKAVKTLYMR